MSKTSKISLVSIQPSYLLYLSYSYYFNQIITLVTYLTRPITWKGINSGIICAYVLN